MSVGNSSLTAIGRNYTRFYYRNTDENGEDFCLLRHSNEIFVLTLAKSHPVFGKEIEEVQFHTEEPEKKFSGKRKKGAYVLTPERKLCTLVCVDESKYVVPSCVFGKLIELNQRLVKSPKLLKGMGNNTQIFVKWLKI